MSALDETHFLKPLFHIAHSGLTPAEELLAAYEGRWGRSVDPVFQGIRILKPDFHQLNPFNSADFYKLTHIKLFTISTKLKFILSGKKIYARDLSLKHFVR